MFLNAYQNFAKDKVISKCKPYFHPLSLIFQTLYPQGKIIKIYPPPPLPPTHLKREIFPAYLCVKDLKTVWNFLKINELKIFHFWSFLSFWTIAHHYEKTSKTRMTKNQENSEYSFGEDCLTNHLVNFFQESIKSLRVGALSVTVCQFFKNNLLVKPPQLLLN